MKQLVFQRRTALIALLAVFVSGCGAELPAPVAEKEQAASARGTQPQIDAVRNSDPAKPAAGESKGTPGLVVHIDPATGEFLPEPQADGVIVPAANAAKAPMPQLKEVPSPTLGGGVMIDLQGQFQTPLVATIDADGKVTMKHETTMPELEPDRK